MQDTNCLTGITRLFSQDNCTKKWRMTVMSQEKKIQSVIRNRETLTVIAALQVFCNQRVYFLPCQQGPNANPRLYGSKTSRRIM